VATTVGGPAIGYAYAHAHGSVATAQDNDQLGACGGENTQVNAFIESLTRATSGSAHNAAETVITLPDGHELFIAAQVLPRGAAPPQTPYCNAG
jgi:hypothetical protein